MKLYTMTGISSQLLSESEAEMTTKGAELAKEADVKRLFLTNLSRRYRERDVLAEAQSVFPDAVVARDFDSFQIKRV